MTKQVTRTYYELLGVSPEATQAEIKEAYLEIARVYHPDSHFYSEIVDYAVPSDQMEIFKSITYAYSVLNDPEKRSKYDRTIAKSKPAPKKEESPSARPKAAPAQKKPVEAFGVFGSIPDDDEPPANEEVRQQAPRPRSMTGYYTTNTRDDRGVEQHGDSRRAILIFLGFCFLLTLLAAIYLILRSKGTAP